MQESIFQVAGRRSLLKWLCVMIPFGLSAQVTPHLNAHAHNDYVHERPLFEALENGFNEVEADVHWHKGRLLVAHARVRRKSKSLEDLYLRPLDSLVRNNKGSVYPGVRNSFFLMVDIKNEAMPTYLAIKDLLSRYPALSCSSAACPVKIFLSGNRPVSEVVSKYEGLALDGRPEDLGQNYSPEVMPVISDTYKKWSSWDGESAPGPGDLAQIHQLAERVHAEEKKLRLWAIPDNERTWEALLQQGVDLINTDHLQQLNRFLINRKDLR